LLHVVSVPLRLEFDRGTITLSGFTEPQVARLPGVMWDARVRVHRAPAYRYATLTEALMRSGVEFEDGVPSALIQPRSGNIRSRRMSIRSPLNSNWTAII
jgi:hypothetical protein